MDYTFAVFLLIPQVELARFATMTHAMATVNLVHSAIDLSFEPIRDFSEDIHTLIVIHGNRCRF